jgi:hypothetical protein
MPKGQPNKGYALTPQRERALRVLAKGPLDADDGRLVGDLARRLGYDNTQRLSMVIKQLETSGLIKRDVAGRRTYHLELDWDAIDPEDYARLGRPTDAAGAAEYADEPLGVMDLTDYRLLADEQPAWPDGIDYRRMADEMAKAGLKWLRQQPRTTENFSPRRPSVGG